MCMGWYTWFSPGADLQGGWAARAPLQLVHQWKYGEGEREEEWRKEKNGERKSDQLLFNPVLHPPLVLTYFLTHP